MNNTGSDIYRIEKIQDMLFLPCDANTLTPYSNNHMLVFMRFKAAVTSGCDFKISHMEFYRFTVVTDQRLPCNIGPVRTGWFVMFGFNPSPCKVAFMFVKPACIVFFSYFMRIEITVKWLFFYHENLPDKFYRKQKPETLLKSYHSF